MDAREYPYYGLGLVAYSIAFADGSVQGSERFELREIVESWSRDIDANFNVTEIIFSIKSKSKVVQENGYEEGLEYIRKGKDYLNESMKEKFLLLIKDLAHAFPPVTEEEKDIVNRFEEDLDNL